MTEIDKESILEKIKKLLALATSSNPNEANVAIAKANELLLRHNLSMSEVEKVGQKEFVEDYIEYDYTMEAKYIRRIIRYYFFVKDILIPYKKVWAVIGTKENVAVATYMYSHIRFKFHQAWTEFKNTNNIEKIAGKTDFYMGLYRGLSDKLDSERVRLEKQEGLIVVEDPELEKKYEEMHPDARPAGPQRQRLGGNQNAQGAGYEAGRNMTLNPGVGGGSAKKNLTFVGKLKAKN